mmetsp:Transcript_15463/g.33631  ORF Transcript_15463/g.33631 Transcript_15463/m.33631 type:complete len:299 (+) Transcript_15463:132-1028(+)
MNIPILCLMFGSFVVLRVTTLQVANGFVIPGGGIPSHAVVSASSRRLSSSRTNFVRLEPSLCARRRRSSDDDVGGVGDDDDEMTYDDAYIDELINEKFDDFDDDEFLDVDVASSKSAATSTDADDSASEDNYEYARVGRRRGRGRDRYGEEGSGMDSGGDGDDNVEMMDADRSSSSSRSRSRSTTTTTRDVYDDNEFDEEDDDFYDEDYEEDYDEDDEDDDFFEEGILIPNPILDAVDPEGAADRIGELFMDPKWWRDAAAIAAVVVAVYVYTFDPNDLIPWDSVTPEDFNFRALYER